MSGDEAMTGTARAAAVATGAPAELATARAVVATRPDARALPIERREALTLGAIVALAAALRFVSLPTRGEFDGDQGNQMLAVWSAIQSGRLPQLGPLSSIGTFHHGALTYDLWIPALWLGNGNPLFVTIQTALLGILVVPLLWWVARTIGGIRAGLITAFLVAISASLIRYSTFIWNPTLIEPGAALAVFATWEAWRTRNPRWWAVTGIGLAIVMQAHIAGPALALPLACAFVAALVRDPRQRRRQLAWGATGIAIVAVTYLPFLAYEVGHGFGETRAVVGFFGSSDSAAKFSPLARLFVAFVRLIAWPVTGWPISDNPGRGLLVAFPLAMVVAFALGWRAAMTRRAIAAATGRSEPTAGHGDATEGHGDVARLRDRRDGIALVGLGLGLLIVVLGLGLRHVSEIEVPELPTEQYHAYADPLALIATGLVLAGIWESRLRIRRLPIGPACAALLILGIAAWNVTHAPPLDAADGGWPAAQAAADRLEADAGEPELAIVSLPSAKWPDAYGYPLRLDGVRLVPPETAGTVVVLCDSYLIESGCGGSQEDAFVAALPGGNSMRLVDRFSPGRYRNLSVYKRVP